MTCCSHPKKGLANRVVPDDLLVRRIWIQRLPEIDVFLLVAGDAREQQTGRANRQSVEMLNVFCPLPCALGLKVRIDEFRAFAEPTAIGKAKKRRIWSKSF